jgi:predicted DNA-binding transcriptional regulator YafY
VYLVTSEFKPVYDTSSPSRLLNELLAHAVGVIGDESSFIGWRAPVGYVPTPGRTLSADTLAVLLRAVREGRVVQLVYQSMNAEKPEPRQISPHAFAYDGFRWHVRAYCHKHQAFRDFVIARMAGVKLGDLAAVLGAENDVEWHTEVTLELESHPGLSVAQKRAIELDYGMTNGVVSLKCRQALLFYVLRHLHLDRTESGTPEQQQVVLKSLIQAPQKGEQNER